MNKLYTSYLVSSALLGGVMAFQNKPGNRPTSAGADLAAKAYAVMEKHCAACHGKDPVAGFAFRDYNAMLSKGKVRPGEPERSPVYRRVALSPDNPMPPRSANNPLTADEKALLKAWIAAGAPKLDSPPSPAFLPETYTLRAVANDLDSADERTRRFLRYFTLVNLRNGGASAEETEAYRKGLFKLLNSLSWERAIAVPRAIDTARLIYRIDLRDYSWEDRTWQKLLDAYPYALVTTTQPAAHIQNAAHCRLAYVRADWFVTNAALPPLYHDLLDIPKTLHELEARLMVDRERDVRQEKAMRAGFVQSGVSSANRVVQRHTSAYGAYWISFDFFSSGAEANIMQHPLDFHQAGGEVIFNLPNGLQGYMLVDAAGNRLDAAPPDIVSNRENPADPVVRNGLSCMGCHAQGMRDFTDEVRATVLKTSNPAFDRGKALALYAEPDRMKAAVEEDKARFAAAVRATGSDFAIATSTNDVRPVEPIMALQSQYDTALDLRQAAADLGMSASDLKSRIQADSGLNNLVGALLTPGGRVKRDAWETDFERLARIGRPDAQYLRRLVVIRRFVRPGDVPQLIGKLRLDSQPSGARVWVGGQEQGRTQLLVPIFLGQEPAREVKVLVKADGYKPWERLVTITRGQETDLGEIELEKMTLLKVESDPPRARIRVDGQDRGETPLYLDAEAILGEEKRREVEVVGSLNGYEDKKLTVTLKRGETTDLGKLALNKQGNLALRFEPDERLRVREWEWVVDGSPVPHGALSARLSPGPHKIELRWHGTGYTWVSRDPFTGRKTHTGYTTEAWRCHFDVTEEAQILVATAQLDIQEAGEYKTVRLKRTFTLNSKEIKMDK